MSAKSFLRGFGFNGIMSGIDPLCQIVHETYSVTFGTFLETFI